MTEPPMAEATTGATRPAALVLHGFTGSPRSVLPLADAFRAAGFAVELPLLPGHGASAEELERSSFSDWLGAAERALDALAARGAPVVVAGHSMGGTLACSLAASHPRINALVLVNPFIEPPAPSFEDLLEAALATGSRTIPSIGGDVARPDAVAEEGEATPIRPLLSLVRGVRELAGRLGEITCPTLCFSSRTDHVVDPASSDYLEARVVGPFERVVLEHSYHVALLDYDAPMIIERALAFAHGQCA